MIIVGAVVVALALRVYQLSRPDYLLGVTEYDDGPYFGSAVRLIHGSLPYRDFVLVQPPGITLLMSPVALLTKLTSTAWGMAAGRILTTLASAAGVALAGLLVRHRGVLATLLTCGIIAVYPASVAAAHTVLVEPWLVLFCLLGALAVFSGDRPATSHRRLAWGGLAFGFAGAVEAWAIMPVLVLTVVLATTGPQAIGQRIKRAGIYVAGVAAGFLIPVLPFAALSPGGFFHSLITAQVGPRANPRRVPIWARAREIIGITDLHLPSHTVVAFIALAFVIAVFGLTLAGWWLMNQPPPPLDSFALAATVAIVAIFLWPAQFHYHFPAFLAPFLAMAIGLPVARITAAIEATRRHPIPLTQGVSLIAIAVLLVFAGLHARTEKDLGYYASLTTTAADRLQKIIPAGDCVLTDQVSYLLVADRFNSDVPGCSQMVDGLGTDLALSGGLTPRTGAGNVPAVAAVWRTGFTHAQYVWLTFHAYRRVAWNASLRLYFQQNFVQVMRDPRGDVLYARRGLPGTH
jgi:hypothetical protein